MSDDPFKPKPDTSKSERKKSPTKRSTQVQAAKDKLQGERTGSGQNPIVDNATYGELRENNRVVMRHQIALNLESFRAAPDDFQLRPTRNYPQLRPTVAPFLSHHSAEFEWDEVVANADGGVGKADFSRL